MFSTRSQINTQKQLLSLFLELKDREELYELTMKTRMTTDIKGIDQQVIPTIQALITSTKQFVMLSNPIEITLPKAHNRTKWITLHNIDYKSLLKELDNYADRIVFIYLPLTFESKQGHANLLIIDMNTRNMYRFEPHSVDTDGDYSRVLDSFLDKEVAVQLNLKYQSPARTYPHPGPQSIEFDYKRPQTTHEGFCVIYCILFAHLYILKSDFTAIMQYLCNLSGKQLYEYIRRYKTLCDCTEYKG